jgi:hypothetical protein
MTLHSASKRKPKRSLLLRVKLAATGHIVPGYATAAVIAPVHRSIQDVLVFAMEDLLVFALDDQQTERYDKKTSGQAHEPSRWPIYS